MVLTLPYKKIRYIVDFLSFVLLAKNFQLAYKVVVYLHSRSFTYRGFLRKE